MGGCGSGRTAEKATFESGLHLDLDRLIRGGHIQPGCWSGSLIWRRIPTGEEAASIGYTATMDVDAGTGSFDIRCTITDWHGERHHVHQHVPLEGVPQRFGGWRWYFRCPVTGDRCRKLYRLPGGRRFAARAAWRAHYLSQRQSPHDRTITQAQKLRKRLSASLAIGDWVCRPKGMHQTTFERHRARLERQEIVVTGHAVALINRLRARSCRR